MVQLTSRQLSEWEAYDRLDPVGEWRNEFSMARLTAMVVNIANALYPKKGHKPVVTSPIDFMPDWGGDQVEKEIEKQSVEDMKQILLGIARVQNRKVGMQQRKPPVKNINRREK